MDVFVDIPGYPGYKVNRLGECIGPRGWLLKPNMIKKGHYQVCLYLNDKRKMMLVHRIVALTFIPNPNNLATINHKDENKANNCVDNLEWMTAEDNLKIRSSYLKAKGYCKYQTGWRVQYYIDGKQHQKYFRGNDEEGAQFYISLLRAIYPRGIF